MLHILVILLRAHFSQNVKYWYKICDVLVPSFPRCGELVPIFHGVKLFAVRQSSLRGSGWGIMISE